MCEAKQKLRQIPVRSEINPDYARRLKQKPGFVSKLEALFANHTDKLIYIHIIMFIGFMILTIIPTFMPTPPEQASPLNNFSLFAQFLLWGLWFPLVFASVIFSGRSWCGIICPMGAASEWANKIGRKKSIPAWLRWEGTPIISFIIVTILGQTIDVRDQASAILELFLGTLIIALLIGFFYGKNKRAWCRHVCPIGLLLGVFSRIGIVQLSPKHPRPGGDTYTEKGICPTMIGVSQKQESRHCIQCFRCVKPSSPGGLFLEFRHPGKEVEQIRRHNANPAEVWFLFMGTGIALGGFLWLILPSFQVWRQALGTWFIEHGWYWIGQAGPSWLMSVHPVERQVYNWLDFFMITGYMLFWMGLSAVILGTCTAINSYLAGKFGADQTFRARFYELGYQFAPVALISIIISLGDKLFSVLTDMGTSNVILGIIKGSLLALSIIWSIYLGHKLLSSQGLRGIKRSIALIPGAIGSLLVGLAWWPAIFGVSFSLLENYRHHLVFIQ